MSNGELAAWVQAVGSILAIGAGFALAARERRIANREQSRRDLLEAKAICGLIQADVLVWRGRLERIGPDDDVLRLDIPTPPSVETRLDRMMLLGIAGVELILAVGYSAAHREMLKDFDALPALQWNQGRNAAERLAMDRLREIHRAVASAHKGIGEIIEKKLT